MKKGETKIEKSRDKIDTRCDRDTKYNYQPVDFDTKSVK